MKNGSAKFRNCGSKWSGLKSAPVGSFKANPWGLYDVHGNVLEFVGDCWTTSHEGAAKNASPRIIANCLSRVIKSGAWYYLPTVSRSAYRARNDTRVFSYFIGFRVVRKLNQNKYLSFQIDTLDRLVIFHNVVLISMGNCSSFQDSSCQNICIITLLGSCSGGISVGSHLDQKLSFKC